MVFVLYFTAAYISIYQIRLSSAPCLLLYVVFSLLSVLTRIFGSGVETRLGLEGLINTLGGYQSPFVFLHPSASSPVSKCKIRSDRPKKSFLPSPPFPLVYIYCMTAILSANFSGKPSHFPASEACCPLLPILQLPLSALPVQHIWWIACIRGFTVWSFGKKWKEKWMRSQNEFIEASKKASEAFHSLYFSIRLT